MSDAATLSHTQAAISERLLQARRSVARLPQFPADVPPTLAEAYAIQHTSLKAWDDTVVGWKVGGLGPELASKLGAAKLTGPIFAKTVVHTDGKTSVDMPVYPGFAAVESEFVFLLGDSAAQDRLFIGIEVASSPLVDINDIGPTAVVCDFGNNAGLLVGPEVADWQTKTLPAMAVTTTIDGHVVGQRQFENPVSDALVSLAFLREHAAHYGIDLPAGTFVSSGAITGVHEAEAGAQATADFGVFGQVKLAFVAMQASAN